jgi:hypothetical protein
MDSRKLLAGLILGSAMLVACEESANRGGTTTPPRSTTPRAGDTDLDDIGTRGGQNQGVQRAQTLIDQVNSHIRNKDYTAAETTLRELESMKSQLPQDMQAEITALRASVNTAKQQPGMPGSQTPPPSQPPGVNP